MYLCRYKVDRLLISRTRELKLTEALRGQRHQPSAIKILIVCSEAETINFNLIV